MHDLRGKVALVTGLGQSEGEGWGIGAACAVLLAKKGAKVFGGNRTLDSAIRTQKHFQEDGGVCDVVQADVINSASVQPLVHACLDKRGRIDILLNNLGPSEPVDPASMSEEAWDARMDINLKSVYLTCHFVLPITESQGSGCVVNIGSIAGLRYIGKPQIAYNVTKAALLQFAMATAVIYAKKGVRLNTVVAGLMETPYTFQMATRYADGDYEKFKNTRNAQVPMGRMGGTWDVAHAALFLVSEEARYITGQEVVVDGGITCPTGPV
ncbi:hypothetical protein CBER1_10255 [Cercospora berteroae]|uniref:Uncharacterized protein n=1 Tax=Cercospora berteroae TaxID=357750 RepID=A0A2S6BYI7_9PEZI|nr:hypothetical protein CBER1_10255 [Cercospora berteroae]